MDSEWNLIENIIESDADYECFRLRTKKFMYQHSMTINRLSVETGISRTILTSFLRDGYRRLSFRTLSKLINFMEDYPARVTKP